MTKTEILKKILLQLWYYILAYFTHYLFPKIKEALTESKEHFLSYLWNSLKEDVKSQITRVLKDTEYFFQSESFIVKEKIIIDILFNRIKLPFSFKLFKPILKKLLQKKLHEIILESLKVTQKKLDQIA